ncbi:hypothetical protein SNEBB_004854 [Seison nebaliae]|nr:hypothetical protein SNEBB_004854 [Seison nebaliae]
METMVQEMHFVSSKNFTAQYLAMELIRSHYLNVGGIKKGGPYAPNYLEYYIRFDDTSPSGGGVIHSMLSKICLFFGCHRKTSWCMYDSLFPAVSRIETKTYFVLERMLRILFGNSNTVFIYKPNKTEIIEANEPFIKDKEEFNQISIWPKLKFWSFSLRNITNKQVAFEDSSYCSKFNITSFIIFPFTNEGIREKLKNEVKESGLPNWVTLNYEFYNPHYIGYMKRVIDDSYFGKIAHILRTKNIEDVRHSVLSIKILLYSYWNCLSPTTQIEDIELFQEIDINNKSIKYDLTGIQYRIYPRVQMIDPILSLTDLKNTSTLTNDQKRVLDKCINLYTQKSDDNMEFLLKNLPLAQTNYKQLKPLLQNIFKMVCLNIQTINSTKIEPTTAVAHVCAIVRSLYSNDWYTISDDNIYPIIDIQQFLLAFRFETTSLFMFTRKDTFDAGVTKWKMILQKYHM